MSNFKQFFGNVLRNNALHYVLSRYATYLLQFVNSIFIAVYLGAFYLGVWGFITMVLQYINQFNFGIPHSLNAIISVHKEKKLYVQRIVGNSITMLLGLILFGFLFFLLIYTFGSTFGEKYYFSKYMFVVFAIGGVGHFNVLFSNVFRVYGRLFELAFSQTIFPVLMLMAIVFFKGESLVWALVIFNLGAFLLSLFLFIVRSPVKITPAFDFRLFKVIQRKGWYLFIYNASFYLVVITTRSFVSFFYEVEEFGFFTFAFSLANVVSLLLQSFSFLIYPKLLNRFANASTTQISSLLSKVRDVYIVIAHWIAHFSIFIFPFLLLLFPQYESSGVAFKLIVLTIVLHTNSFGYSGLLISKGREKVLAFLSFSALFLNVFLCFILSGLFEVPFNYVIIATMSTYLFYVLGVGYWGRKFLSLRTSMYAILSDVFSYNILIPFLVSIFLVIFSAHEALFIIPVLLTPLLNIKSTKRTLSLAKVVLTNRNLIDF